MKKAVIFDLDGTLADTLGGITHYVNRTTAHFGLSSISQERIKIFVGNGAKVLLQRSLAHLGAIELFDEAFPIYNRLYDANPNHDLRAYDGIIEMLDGLRAAGLKVGVLSNKPHSAAGPVCTFLFGDRIDYCMGNKEGIPHKPDTTGLNIVCDKLGVAPEECIYVGDTDCDMQTGNNGKMLTVGVTWGFRTEKELWDNGAHHVIHHPTELLKLI